MLSDRHAIARCAEAPSAELLRAVTQFNQREYFECHETLEAIWHIERDAARAHARAAGSAEVSASIIYCDDLYKGVLQVGVGCYHLLRNNYRGATMKLQSGASYLVPYAPQCMGIEVARLIADAQTLLAAVVALGPTRFTEFDRALLPLVHLAAPGS